MTIFRAYFSSIIFLVIGSQTVHAQCADTANIYSFVYNGNMYEVVKETKTWLDAADCAAERGGMLAEINDVSEQTAVFNELNSNAGITIGNTTAPDGGGGSYAWIGGNDFQTEGNWIWDGDGDSTGTQFWMGTSSGSPVGGLYNNWGNEPDDFGSGQDGLGLALTNWPLGSAGQWNDVAHTNTLYFVIEYIGVVGVNDLEKSDIRLYPNPCKNQLTIASGQGGQMLHLLSSDGKVIRTISTDQSKTLIELGGISAGLYFIRTEAGESFSFIKE